MDRNNTYLSLDNTQVLKGVAILLLLCHHCWYTGEGYEDIWVYGHPIFREIGLLGKLCVSLFVFLSGYGLTIGTIRNKGMINVLSFYRKRYFKLMINYWLIWFLFVPIGIFIFKRTLHNVYGEHYFVASLVDFFGLFLAVFNHPNGYNATWWFYSCIIVLYLLFPLIWRYRSLGFLLIPLALLIPELCSIPYVINGWALTLILSYLLPFVCGMLFAYNKIPRCKFGVAGKFMTIIVFFLLCGTYLLQNSNMVLWETLLCAWGVFLYKQFHIVTFISKALSFLGRHSFNIFLFHTFIYLYYFHDYIFWSRNPIIVFSTLLFICIPISMFIEYLKKLLKIDLLQAYLTK